MPRARDPNRDKSYEIWREHNGKITNRAIAELLDIPEKTIGGWKSKDKWNDKLNGVLQTKKRSTPNEKDPKTIDTQENRSGNPNPLNQFTERNSSAKKHGLFSRYMPKETLEIMGMVAGSSPVDLLWMQIELQFAAIIRAQEIMFVESKDEMIKELKKHKDNEFGEEIEYEFQFAWDRQATFLNAQTRALSELRASIKQFIEMSDAEDERRLKLEIMQQQLKKLERENTTDTKTEDKLKEYFTALGGAFRES